MMGSSLINTFLLVMEAFLHLKSCSHFFVRLKCKNNFLILGQNSCKLTGAWFRGQRGQYKLIYDQQGGGHRTACSRCSQLPCCPSLFLLLGPVPSHRPELTDPYTFPATRPHPTFHSLGATFTMFSRYKSHRLKQL